MISITERVAQYLAQRQDFGTGLSDEAVRTLNTFAAFAVNQGADYVTTELFWQWKEQYGSASQQTWSYRLSHVRTFARWLYALEPQTEGPPPGLIPRRRHRPPPYIYRTETITDLITTAAQLSSPRGLRRPTYATLFGLLAVTGMRVGEALGLDDQDVDTEAAVLRIRHAKNNGHRMIPITGCTAQRLVAYRSVRDRLLGSTGLPTFFRNERGQRISIYSAQYNFARVSQTIGLREQNSSRHRGHGPRLHDLRHTFAVHTLLDWNRSGLDPDREMYKLSTWLGHKNPRDTYWYLEAVPELLQWVTQRAEQALTHRRESS